MPFVRTVARTFMLEASSTSARRIGLAVFPGDGNNNNDGDKSGPAQTRISLSPYALSEIENMVQDGQDPQNSDYDAATGLRFPEKRWTYTSTWTAFQQAENNLFADATYGGRKKVVLLVTDGAPSRNRQMGKSMEKARPVYLTTYYAQRLKDRGATILGVGIGGHFLGPFDNCYPLCQRKQLFES